MKDMFKMVLVLAIICVLAGGLLAMINSITKAPIERALREEKLQAMRNVLPDYDNDPVACTNVVIVNGKKWIFHVAVKNNEFVGTAFEASSGDGYSGNIRIIAGIDADNTIRGLEILQQAETPGLGARITENAFRDQFRGRNIDKTAWKVKQDGGDIDGITGATISPRAVLDALQAGLNVYIQHKEDIAASAAE